jgi:hypothetical protein
MLVPVSRAAVRRGGLQLFAVWLALLAACSESRATDAAPATSLAIMPRDTTLAVGSAVRFAPTLRDANGRDVASGSVQWVSRDPATLRVDAAGDAEAIAAGRTWVVASRGTLADSAVVTVTPGPQPVALTVRVNTAVRTTISRFIYGMNASVDTEAPYTGAFPWYGAVPPAAITFDRFGGNRYSAYNWENNFSHAGVDYLHQNDDFLSSSRAPAAAVVSRVARARQRGAATLVTVPMLSHVAGDGNGPVDTLDATRAVRLATRFRRNVATKPGPLADTPDLGDDVVYQDEFVRAITRAFPGATGDAQAPIMFSLDNEPDAWHATHKAILGDSADNPSRPRLQTYEGFLNTTVSFASAIKRVAPDAVVFGPAVATYAGVLTIGRYPYPDPQHGTRSFIEFYLERLAQAEATAGRTLVDVLDLHWYPAIGTNRGEISNDYALQDAAMIRARLQAPRSLWDGSFDENSWVSGVTNGPIRLLPRLRELIQRYKPGMKIAFTEYYFGRSGDISGGLAQADLLGVFGREGVFAANFWPQAGVWAEPWLGDGSKAYAYAFGAFRSFLDYDGQGARFGDIGVSTVATDTVNASAYGSLDAAGRVVLVLINKRAEMARTSVQLTHPSPMRTAQTYVMRDGQATPRPEQSYAVTDNAVVLELPPYSVTTVQFRP